MRAGHMRQLVLLLASPAFGVEPAVHCQSFQTKTGVSQIALPRLAGRGILRPLGMHLGAI